MSLFATQADLAAAVSGAAGAWPVGSVFISVVSANPATLLGFGTWSAFATGRVLIGVDSGDASMDTAEETGGSKTHSHAVGTIAAGDHAAHTHGYSTVLNHTHTVNITDPGHTHGGRGINSGTAGLAGHQGASANNNNNTTTSATQSATTGITATTDNPAGGSASGTTGNPSATLTHSMSGTTATANGLPPFIAVYMWKRTA